MKYVVAFALIGIFGLWGWRCKISYKRRILRLKDFANMEQTVLGGQSAAQWLDILNRDTKYTLIANCAGAMNILGHTVLLFDGYIYYTTLGPTRAIGGRAPMLFLVATDSEAITTLKAHRREFKWLNGTEEYAAFGMRRLDDVIALCKPMKTK